MGLPNCSRVLVYSATRAMDAAAAPAWARASAVVLRWTIHSTMAGPSATLPSNASGPTEAPARVISPSGWPLLAIWRSTVTPADPGSTTNTATPSGSIRAVTSTASANVPDGTQAFTPVRIQPSPDGSATVAGAAGVPPSSTSAVVSTVSPDTTPGSHRCFWALLPNSAMAGAAAASVSTTGTSAAVRPAASASSP